MARILKVSESNYRVKVQEGGNITLDTGVDVGTVFVTGNLVVQGNTTTIDTTNMTIEDNVILLNKGELGAGITEVVSGIEIDRGSLPNAQLFFDEDVDHWNPRDVTIEHPDGILKQGTFVLKEEGEVSSSVTSGLKLAAIVAPGGSDLVFDMGQSAYMLRLANVTNYSSRVTDDDHIPNRRWVTDYVEAGTLVTGQADVDRIYNGTVNPVTEEVTINSQVLTAWAGGASAPTIEFSIRNVALGESTNSVRAIITTNGLNVDNVNVFNNTVQNSASSNLILTAVNENVEINNVLNINDRATAPGSVSGKTRIYSRSQLTPQLSQYPGKTGIFFSNAVNTDELVSKNRALLFSMIF